MTNRRDGPLPSSLSPTQILSTVRSKTVPISQRRKARPPRERMALKRVPEKSFLPLVERMRRHTVFFPLVPRSFSVARKSSLPVLICPEGCDYTFQACASQAGRAPRERRGGGAVSPLLFSVSFSMFTHVPVLRAIMGPSSLHASMVC